MEFGLYQAQQKSRARNALTRGRTGHFTISNIGLFFNQDVRTRFPNFSFTFSRERDIFRPHRRFIRRPIRIGLDAAYCYRPVSIWSVGLLQ